MWLYLMTAESLIKTDNIPPQSLEMEQAILGAMMIERSAIEKAQSILNAEDFYRHAHRVIYEAIIALNIRDEPVDLLTLQEQLRLTNQMEEAGGAPYLLQLMEAVPSAANAEYYARAVEEKAILRRLLDASGQISSMVYQDYEDISEVVDKAEKLVFGVAQRRMGAYFTPMNLLVHQTFSRIENLSDSKMTTTGISTSFEDLNYMTAGFQPSDLVIVAARPSMGKTSLVLSIAQHVAIREKKAVAIFSLEMSKEQLCIRMICSEARVDAHRLRTGFLQKDDWREVGHACAVLSETLIFIDDSPDCSVLEMRAKCRRLKAEHDLGMVVVDYLQLMRGHKRAENRNQEIGEIARALKSLARELQVPVIALSQLSRAVEQRNDKRPMLSDLRESGSIEAEADVVVFIYRDNYYKMKEHQSRDDDVRKGDSYEEDDMEEAELIIAKQRNGPTGMVKVAFHPRYARFDNLANEG